MRAAATPSQQSLVSEGRGGRTPPPAAALGNGQNVRFRGAGGSGTANNGPGGRPLQGKPGATQWQGPGDFAPGEHSQAEMSDRFAMVRGGLDKFPLFACFWCPLVVTLNGCAYFHVWRTAYATSVMNVKDELAPPTAYQALGVWLWIALFVTHLISVPQFLNVGLAQDLDRVHLRRRTFFVALFHSVVVSLPTGICEAVLLWDKDDDVFQIKKNPSVSNGVALAGISTILSLLTPVLLVWYMYLQWFVDKLRRRSEILANKWVRQKYGRNPWARMRRSGAARAEPMQRADAKTQQAAQLREAMINERIREATTPPPAEGAGGEAPSGGGEDVNPSSSQTTAEA